MNNDRNTCICVFCTHFDKNVCICTYFIFIFLEPCPVFILIFYFENFPPCRYALNLLPKIAWGSLETITIKMELDSWEFERFSYLIFAFISKISDLSSMKSFSSWLFPVSTTQTDLSGGLIHQLKFFLEYLFFWMCGILFCRRQSRPWISVIIS